MFENLAGLVPTLQQGADKLHDRFISVERLLARLVDNAESDTNLKQFASRSGEVIIPASKEGDVTFNIDNNELWKVAQVGITGSEGAETKCLVYLGAVSPTNLIDVFSPTGTAAGRASYLIPINGVLIFHFIKQTEGTLCTVNILFERYEIGTAPPALTGMSGEHMDSPRLEDEIPSGDPLSEVHIP